MKTIQKLLKRKRRDLKSKSFAAFSLSELLVVLVIVGITGGVGDCRHSGVNRVA